MPPGAQRKRSYKRGRSPDAGRVEEETEQSPAELGAALGLDAADHLRRHDAYPFFDTLGDLIRTGPTHTNVMDLHVVLVG